MPKKKTRKKKAPRSNPLGPTLKQRQAAGGTMAERRKARFAALKETAGPRKGLTKNTPIRRDSSKAPKSRLTKVAEVVAGPKRKPKPRAATPKRKTVSRSQVRTAAADVGEGLARARVGQGASARQRRLDSVRRIPPAPRFTTSAELDAALRKVLPKKRRQ